MRYETRGNLKFYYFYDASGNLSAIRYYDASGTAHAYFALTNAQGDVVSFYNNNGVLVASYEYDAWGNIISVKDGSGTDISSNENHIANLNPIRYRGYYYDTETGLYYLQSRYYNPQVGRFLNSDNITDSNAGVLGFNTFIYCGNNPVNACDPTGHFVISAFVSSVLIGAAVGGIVSAVAEAGKQLLQKGKIYDGKAIATSAAIGFICGAISGGIGGAIAKTAASATAKTIASVFAEGCVNTIETSLNAICNNDSVSAGGYIYSFASGVASAGIGEIASLKISDSNSKKIQSLTPGQRRKVLNSQNTNEVFSRRDLKNNNYMSSSAYNKYINQGCALGENASSGVTEIFFCLFE